MAETWRELLRTMIDSPTERERLAAALGVNPVTLTRWASGESMPRAMNLRMLLSVLPAAERKRMRTLLAQEYETWFEEDDPSSEEEATEGVEALSVEFYTRVLEVSATTADHLRFWVISQLVMQQTLHTLDHLQAGICIILLQCMPPSGERAKVRSLREVMGQGSPPYSDELRDLSLAGMESLAGYAIETGHPVVLQDAHPERERLLPARKFELERSAQACPILHSTHVAGCLLVSSTQANYFTPVRQALVNAYANLLSLAFREKDFYPLNSIELEVLPPLEVQLPLLTSFRNRAHSIMVESKSPVPWTQAELLTWQSIEEELLQRRAGT